MTTKAKAVETTLVTGLGETLPQITTICEELFETLLGEIPGAAKFSAEKKATLRELAYKFGTAERRHRKLARKVKGGKAEKDE